jgi:ribose 5-phosphate isomerase A
MVNYKKQSAEKAFQLIKPGQTIGLGDGSTLLYLVELIADHEVLAASLTITSSSEKTILKMNELGLKMRRISDLKAVDIYFDGCDQFDRELNALKSGSGIHTIEKILAAMATEFVLVGDSEKYSENFTGQYPVVLEIIPSALSSVTAKLKAAFPATNGKLRPSLTARDNYLLDLKFDKFPDLSLLNSFIKMLPGVVEHSLFFRMAAKAIVSGPDGTRIINSPFSEI